MRLPILNALRMFDAAARKGSFARAATELNITQGAIAQQVWGLEKALRLILFHRLTLTETGAAYHAAIAEAFQSIAVTSRKVVRLFSEQLRLQFVPVLHCLQGSFAAQG
jgi:LysR family glycine cleavage system transcriptional activator